MNLDRQLETIQRNRAKPQRTETLQAPLRRWLDSLATTEDVRRIYDAIGPKDEEEFRRHCRIAEVRGGALVVYVAEPSLVAVMRARWQGKLLGALGGMSRGAQGRIRFAHDESVGETKRGGRGAIGDDNTAAR